MATNTMIDFEEFLQYKHMELFPQILDDELPDAFDEWLEELQFEDFIKYANEYKVYEQKR